MNRTTIALAAAAAATLALSACADDGDGGGGGGGSDSGGTITVMVLESQTGVAGVDQTANLGADAAAQSLNADGGINGRDVEVLLCDTASDPNKAGDCAREAIDEGVVAVVGSFDPLGSGTSLPILEAAGIPYLSPLAIFPQDFQSSVSFPVTSGSPGGTNGIALAADDADCQLVAAAGDRAIDQGQLDRLVDNLEELGMEAYGVNLPTGTADVTPIVSEILDRDPDCFAFASDGNTGVQLFTAIRRAGSDLQFLTAQAVILPPFLQSLGETADGLIATSDTLSLDHPDLQPFRDDMEQYQPDVASSPFTLMGWYGVRTLAEIADGLDEITAASVLEAANNTSDLELPGLLPVDFTQTRDSELYPRMFSTQIRYATAENGVYVAQDDEWHDAGDLIP